MNYKAVATYSNGHTFEFGSCQSEVKKILGGQKYVNRKDMLKLIKIYITDCSLS